MILYILHILIMTEVIGLLYNGKYFVLKCTVQCKTIILLFKRIKKLAFGHPFANVNWIHNTTLIEHTTVYYHYRNVLTVIMSLKIQYYEQHVGKVSLNLVSKGHLYYFKE